MLRLERKPRVADHLDLKQDLTDTPRYKENPLRRAQKVLECCNGFPVKATLRILLWTRQIPAQSELAQKLSERPDAITPDDITLAGLEIYMLNLKILASGGHPKAVRGIDVGTVLDVLDGAYARATDQAREFGAVTDVVADRFGELYGVWLLFFQLESRLRADDQRETLNDLRDGLIKTMVLSTIVKSIAEIYGVKIPEHSEAGMKARRQKLVRWLKKLGKGEKVDAILEEVQQLNGAAIKVASARLKVIGEAISDTGREQTAVRVSKSGSAARVEALKLIANVLLVEKVVPVLFADGESGLELGHDLDISYGDIKAMLQGILPGGKEYDLENILSEVVSAIEALFRDSSTKTNYEKALDDLFRRVLAIKNRVERK